MNEDPILCRTCGSTLHGRDFECSNCLFQFALDVGTVERTRAPAFAPPDADRLAALMPDLELQELIGRGGMGAVYKVRQIRLGRLAALKVLPPERAADPAFVERFFREAQVLAQFSHPNIVDVYDMGQRGPFMYILMEYVVGRSLRDVIRDGGPTAAEALRLTMNLCAALQYAHDLGVVHRDIKPENVIQGPSGVKLLDFGLVKLTEDSRLNRFTLTEINLRMGTPQYMAPEQASGTNAVDHRADIYAMGVLLYELLCGTPPAVNYAPPSRRVAIDPRVDRVVERALHESPEQRYQRADEMRRDIEHIVRTPRRRQLMIGAVAAMLLAILVGAVLWYRAATADPAPPPGTPIDGVPIAVVPFDAAQAHEHQQRWAEHLGVPVEWVNSLGMKFALIPPGEYTRGAPETDLSYWLGDFAKNSPDAALLSVRYSLFPAHRVRLTQAYYMATIETTQAQYKRVVNVDQGFFRVGGAGEHRLADRNTEDLPVENLAWAGAESFCRLLSDLEGVQPASRGYRLPTEAEWEFALRAGSTTRFWYGPEADQAGAYEISMVHTPLRTRKVASLRANPFGLYDMAGNVSEYCSDWWAPDAYAKYAHRCAVDPTGPEDGSSGGYQRLVRGANFGELSEQQSNWHTRNDPNLWQNTIGFRVVIPAETVARMAKKTAPTLTP